MPEKLKLTPAQTAVEIARRSSRLAAEENRRVIIGIAGGPGSGKSTLAADVIGILNGQVDGSAARVPMDGFHMMQSKLEAEELVAHKGAPQTFEAREYILLLKHLRMATDPVSVPGYSRVKEEVVHDAFTIAANVPILITEGNYLLLESSPWHEIRKLMDLAFYIDVPRNIVRKRLLKRHAEHGNFTEERNKRHVEEVDLVNYDAVAESAGRSDVWIQVDTNT